MPLGDADKVGKYGIATTVQGDTYSKYTDLTESIYRISDGLTEKILEESGWAFPQINAQAAIIHFLQQKQAAIITKLGELEGDNSSGDALFKSWAIVVNGTQKEHVKDGDALDFTDGRDIDITYNTSTNDLTISRARVGMTTLSSNDTTPSVKKTDLYVVQNTSTTIISAFDDGLEAQEITVIVQDTKTSFKHEGGNIFLLDGKDTSTFKGPTTFRFIRLKSDEWYEISRTSNFAAKGK